MVVHCLSWFLDLEQNAVPVAEFAQYVALGHSNTDQKFCEEFEVSAAFYLRDWKIKMKKLAFYSRFVHVILTTHYSMQNS